MAKKDTQKTKYRVKHDKQMYSNIVSALAYILLGIMFCIWKDAVLKWIMLIFGVLLIVKGTVDVLARFVTVGAIEIAIGVLTIIFGFTAVQVALIVFGILIAVYGFSGLLNGGYKNLFTLIVCGLTIAGGILLACNSSGAIQWLFIVVGVMFIVDGVLALLGKKVKS